MDILIIILICLLFMLLVTFVCVLVELIEKNELEKERKREKRKRDFMIEFLATLGLKEHQLFSEVRKDMYEVIEKYVD